MPILPIIEVPDPRLRQTSVPVEAFDDDLHRLIDDMFETMYAAPGIGLAAIQVAVPRRALVLDLQEPGPSEVEGEEGEPVRDPRVYVNPRILWQSDTLKPYNEGCLSIPEMYGEVDRPDRIRLRWQDRAGAPHEAELDGLLAVVVQHEIDHLNGVLFIDHLSRLKRDMLLKKLAKLRREGGKNAA